MLNITNLPESKNELTRQNYRIELRMSYELSRNDEMYLLIYTHFHQCKLTSILIQFLELEKDEE